jgi:hypothetical protein
MDMAKDQMSQELEKKSSSGFF